MVDGRFSSLFIRSLSRFSFRQFWTLCTSTSHEFTLWERTTRTNILIAILRLSHFPRRLSLEWRLTKMKRFVLNLLLMITFPACVEYQILILFLKWFCVHEIWFGLRGVLSICVSIQESFLALLLNRYQFIERIYPHQVYFDWTKNKNIQSSAKTKTYLF